MDQRAFDNQRVVLPAREAAALLGVKLQTLYAYASRGLIRRVPGSSARTRGYLREDVERVKVRAHARSGHGPVAAGALRWGEPVLESSITEIRPDGLFYLGRSAVELARTDASVEQVAEWLWSGHWTDAPPPWSPPADRRLRNALTTLGRLLPIGTPPLVALQLWVSTLGARDPEAFHGSASAQLELSRVLLRRLPLALVAWSERSRIEAVLAAPSFVAAVACSLGVRPAPATLRLLQHALVVIADHELNASTFAARVAASTGATIHACLSAALAVLSGPEHGGATDRIEAMMREVGRPERARTVLADRRRRGESVPGFGHPLYPGGDPRAAFLLDEVRRLGRKSRSLTTLLAITDAAATARFEPPTVDLALVSVAAALGLPDGAAGALFALGRSTGWLAHVFEQRRRPALLRPRARFVPAQ